MPVLFDEKRIFFSSAEKEAPEIAVVARNCSIVYCFEGRPGGAARIGAAARTSANAAREKRREDFMDRSFVRTGILFRRQAPGLTPPAARGERGSRRSTRTPPSRGPSGRGQGSVRGGSRSAPGVSTGLPRARPP